MTTQSEALKALDTALWRARAEATPTSILHIQVGHAIDALGQLKTALAQTEQEPVAWTEKVGGIGFKEPMPNANYKVTATIAPQRKPLTDEQIADIVVEMNGNEPTAPFWRDLARAIEAAHGIKE